MEKNFGERLKQIRNSHSMTHQDFAESLGITRLTVIRYENGERFPDAQFLLALHEKYFVDINWLLTGKGDMGLSNQGTEYTADDLSLINMLSMFSPDTKKSLLVMMNNLLKDLA